MEVYTVEAMHSKLSCTQSWIYSNPLTVKELVSGNSGSECRGDTCSLRVTIATLPFNMKTAINGKCRQQLWKCSFNDSAVSLLTASMTEVPETREKNKQHVTQYRNFTESSCPRLCWLSALHLTNHWRMQVSLDQSFERLHCSLYNWTHGYSAWLNGTGKGQTA